MYIPTDTTFIAREVEVEGQTIWEVEVRPFGFIRRAETWMMALALVIRDFQEELGVKFILERRKED